LEGDGDGDSEGKEEKLCNAAVVECEKEVVQPEDVHWEDKKPDMEKTTAAPTAAATATEAKANPKPAVPLNEAEQEAQRVAILLDRDEILQTEQDPVGSLQNRLWVPKDKN